MQKTSQYTPLKGEIFHVHTWRCKHASEEQDYEYIEKAIALHAPRIVFTDHCPFPGNRIPYRMDIEQLPDYVSSIKALREKYAGQIEVLCGLEIEYLPSFHNYFRSLKESRDFDLFILGQHFFEYPDGHLDIDDKDRTNAYMGLCDTMETAIATGLFDVVAHPDRVFRKKRFFDELAKAYSLKVINAAIKQDIYMEKNFTSMTKSNGEDKFFWPDFWDMLPEDAKVLYGFDAHATEEMERFHLMLIE